MHRPGDQLRANRPNFVMHIHPVTVLLPRQQHFLMTLPHATGPPAGARTLTPALCWMQHDGCMPADAGVGFTDVGSGIPGTHSSHFDSATFQSWGSAFYARLAAHVARACDSIGCAGCHGALCPLGFPEEFPIATSPRVSLSSRISCTVPSRFFS